MNQEQARLLQEIRLLLLQIKPRRPLFDEWPDGYLESDSDWLANNGETLVRIMELATKERA